MYDMIALALQAERQVDHLQHAVAGTFRDADRLHRIGRPDEGDQGGRHHHAQPHPPGHQEEDGSYPNAPLRLMRDPQNTPIKASEVTIGSVYHVLPEGIEKSEHPLNEKGKAAVLLMRLDPDDILVKKERDWGYQGIVAYSKICTHVGCPVGLYEQQTHHLLCPCHQSTFDVTQDCKVIFGPAHRPLPQLKITVDDEGYLVADSGFAEAVGPSFWERG